MLPLFTGVVLDFAFVFVGVDVVLRMKFSGSESESSKFYRVVGLLTASAISFNFSF